MQASTHPISQEELMAYLDGELPAERASVAAAHLEHCRECQSLAADLQIVARRLLEWQIEEPSAELDARIREVLDSKPPVAHSGKSAAFSVARQRWLWAVMAAAIILVGIVIPRAAKRHSNFRNLEQYAKLQQAPRFALKRFIPQGSANGVVGEVGQAVLPPAPAPVPAMAPTGPVIIRTAELSLTTREFDKIHGDIDGILAAYQGYIAHLAVTSPPDQGRSLDATLKVPAAQLDRVLSALKKLGRIDAESQTGQEVTQQVVDLTARLSNARNSEQRLTQILRERTGKLADVLAVEEQIDNVRGQIEQMQAEQESLSHQIAFANIDLKVAEEYSQPLAVDHSSTLTRLRNAAIEGYRSVIDGAIDVVLFLLAYGPAVLIVAAIVFFPARALWKRRKRATA